MSDHTIRAIAFMLAAGFFVSTTIKPLQAEGVAKQTIEATPKSLVITPQGLGKLSMKTHLDEASLKDALPGYQLKKSVRSDQDESYEIFEYYRQGNLAVEVYPDSTKQRILSIVVIDKSIAAPKNARIGMTYQEVAQKNPGIVCTPGVEAANRQVICMMKNARTLKYVFAPSNWKGSETAVPPKSILNRATLVKLAIVFR